jgi:hypothetical protein
LNAITSSPPSPDLTFASGPYEPDGFAAAVGCATHHVIGTVLRSAAAAPREQLLDLVWDLAATGVMLPSLNRRRRAARIAVAGHAGVYVERFLPASPWTYLGAELALGDGLRADLAFEGPAGVFLDEVKLADARSVETRADSTHRQVTAYAAQAAEMFGSRFLGVRLLYLAAPNRSLLVRRDGGRIPLAESQLRAVGSRELC